MQVPLEIDVVATDDVVIRIMDVRAYDRGMLVRVEAWLHPDAAVRARDVHGLPEEPQIGLLLDGVTRLGAGEPGHSPDVGPTESSTDAPLFTTAGGGTGELSVTQTWRVAPVPTGMPSSSSRGRHSTCRRPLSASTSMRCARPARAPASSGRCPTSKRRSSDGSVTRPWAHGIQAVTRPLDG
ncbi:hypothetical protein ASG74_00475 [Knoellia sp. Soil729]|nr:hypothetical protein ASG74_00475 [Knoellia sp. Soil729]